MPSVLEQLTSYDFLLEQMRRFTTSHLVNTDPAEFRARIDSFLSCRDHAMEGYLDPQRQRDLSIQFHWGHDHDFGDFALAGRMSDRHLTVLSMFMDVFRALPNDLSGRRVLDIGCWTGGTSMLLCALGAEVVAIEEVKKYVECLRYLRDAFALDALEVQHRSLYDCDIAEFRDAFDYVLFAGVLYHVSDPVVALRIAFNALNDGGTCLVESQAVDSPEPVLTYHGPRVNGGGTAEDLNRWGWNWLLPSPEALGRMMEDVGFASVRKSNVINGRMFAVGTRTRHVDLLRAGLSRREIY